MCVAYYYISDPSSLTPHKQPQNNYSNNPIITTVLDPPHTPHTQQVHVVVLPGVEHCYCRLPSFPFFLLDK